MHKSTENIRLLSWSRVCESLAVSVQQKIREYSVVERIDSTNNWALNHCQSVDSLPAVCVAEYQSLGRGRRGRSWVSPYGQNIYISLAWSFKVSVAQLSGLGLMVAVVVVRLLKMYGVQGEIKWPNDVLVDGKKIAGALIETRIKEAGSACVVIGVGLNFNMCPEAGTEIDQPWTAMLHELADADALDRNEVVGRLISMLVDACESYEKMGLEPFLPEWQASDMCYGREIDVVTDQGCQQGIAHGVDHQGGLRVRMNNVETIVYAADVSIRVR